MASDIPAELQRVIARCLRKDPRRRFQHMADLMVALEELREESASGALAVPAAVHAPARGWRTWIAAAAALVMVVGAVWWLTRGAATKPVLTPTEVSLTSDLGIERSPSFSPDGNQVAFSWNGEKQDNYDIYVKLIGSPTPLRLTTDPDADSAPAFSPDGRSIGFIRAGKGHNLLITVPPIGGPERVVAELPEAGQYYPSFSWLPDGKQVVVDGLAVLSTDSGEVRRLTTPPANSEDFMPAVAPDGHAVAFARGGMMRGADVYVIGLNAGAKAAGQAQRLTTTNHSINGIAWTADSAALVVSSGALSAPPDLWRVPVSPRGEPRELPFGHGGGSTPAIARTGDRLVYSRELSVVNMWRLPLTAAGTQGATPTRFLPSTRREFLADYSPDGKRVVFHSSRSGKPGLWVGDADGSKAAELYVPAQGHAGSPVWSPDGQTVAFDWNETGLWEVYTIRAGGGKPNRLTKDPVGGFSPSWSRDGKWIYFASGNSSRSEVLKIPSSGGEAVRVTQNGGCVAKESNDGRFLYYTKGESATGLWRMPANGGEESLVVPSISGRQFALSSQGLYFVPQKSEGHQYALYYLAFDGGKSKVVLNLPRTPLMGLAVSPDGRFLLYTQYEQSSQELILVENFR